MRRAFLISALLSLPACTSPASRDAALTPEQVKEVSEWTELVRARTSGALRRAGIEVLWHQSSPVTGLIKVTIIVDQNGNILRLVSAGTSASNETDARLYQMIKQTGSYMWPPRFMRNGPGPFRLEFDFKLGRNPPE
jgi:outer membrane biogenesis lipoprotein LolB